MQSQQKPDHEATISGEWHVRYNYSVGKVAGHFFEELRRGKIFASFCSASNMAYLPPRAYCERSFAPCDGWVEVGLEGVIEAATIVVAAFENLPPPPYAIAYVRLDGASTAMINFVRGLDLTNVESAAKRLSPGARVGVQFESERQGRMDDFHYILLK